MRSSYCDGSDSDVRCGTVAGGAATHRAWRRRRDADAASDTDSADSDDQTTCSGMGFMTRILSRSQAGPSQWHLAGTEPARGRLIRVIMIESGSCYRLTVMTSMNRLALPQLASQ